MVLFWNRSGTVPAKEISHKKRRIDCTFPPVNVLSKVGTGQWSNQCLTTNLPTWATQLWEFFTLLLITTVDYLLSTVPVQFSTLGTTGVSSHEHVFATKMHSDIVVRVWTLGQWLLIQSHAVSNIWRSVTSDLPPMM